MLRRLSLIALLGLASGPAALAAPDAACKPIIDADKGRAAAKAWHNKKSMNGTSMEMIRLGDDIYANMGNSGWRKMPPGMAKTIANVGEKADNFNVSECKRLGEERVGDVATTIYAFKTTIPGQPPFAGKVWVGNEDGLPYREAGDRYDGTTSYTGVTAPSLK